MISPIYGELKEKWRPSRSQVRGVACPVCGRLPGKRCAKYNRRRRAWVDREQSHEERVHAYLDWAEAQ